jgi:hypothetical protein
MNRNKNNILKVWESLDYMDFLYKRTLENLQLNGEFEVLWKLRTCLRVNKANCLLLLISCIPSQ